MNNKAQWMMIVGGIVFAVLGSVFIAPALFPSATPRGGRVNYAQSACVGVCGMVGAVLGAVLGKRLDQ